jgi:hypothetical protein
MGDTVQLAQDQARLLFEDGMGRNLEPVERELNIIGRPHEYENWILAVSNILEKNNLKDLIRAKLPRPIENHPQYMRWKMTSGAVKLWLVNQVEYDMITCSRTSGLPIDYADDIYRRRRRGGSRAQREADTCNQVGREEALGKSRGG